jgi:aldose 1-epimerase
LSTTRSEPVAAPRSLPEPPTGAQFELRRDGTVAVVTEVGAGLRSWRVGGEELLDTFAATAPADSYRGKVLAPWPNRIRDGRYRFSGAEHRTPLTEPGRSAALHGLVLDERFAVVRRSGDEVVLAHVLRPRPGYPFALEIRIGYALGADGLAITLRATNASDVPAPFGAGLHPYLRAPGGRIDDGVLAIPASTRVPVDERMLPAGPEVPVAGTDYDFTRARRVGAQRLDTCFGGLARHADGRARVRLAAADGGREVTVWMDAAFRYVHVYTADAVDDPARARAGIAVEPVTCAPDAFNSGAGLVVIEPGASFTGRCGLVAAGIQPTARTAPTHKE